MDLKNGEWSQGRMTKGGRLRHTHKLNHSHSLSLSHAHFHLPCCPPLPRSFISGSTTRFTFAIRYDAAKAGLSCGRMSIDSLVLQLAATLPGTPTAVTFAGLAAPFSLSGSALTVRLSGYGSVAASTALTIDFNTVTSLAGICTTPWYGQAACPYTLVSTPATACCPNGYINNIGGSGF
jgi:hypothetical protein